MGKAREMKRQRADLMISAAGMEKNGCGNIIYCHYHHNNKYRSKDHDWILCTSSPRSLRK